MRAERLSANELSQVEECLQQYLRFGERFIGPPQVRLVLFSQTPSGRKDVGVRDIAASTAIQCYSPGSASMTPRQEVWEQSIADSTLDAGHLTTRQHVHFTWHLSGVSRQLVHDVLHNHMFYNSEQQSQRYVEVADGSFFVPGGLTEHQAALYADAAENANRAYFELLSLLPEYVEARLWQSNPPSRFKSAEGKTTLADKVKKLSQEVARYVVPIAQKTRLFHTLNELQLLRLWGVSRQEHFSDEARFVIASMVKSVAERDPSFLHELRAPLVPRRAIDTNEKLVAEHNDDVDGLLSEKGSLLLSSLTGAEKRVLADAVRNAGGVPVWKMYGREALGFVFDPLVNSVVADVQDVGMMDPVTSALRQLHLTYLTQLSHAADSQRQRHRMTPGATPSVEASYSGKPDYFTPLVIRENLALKDLYEKRMEEIYFRVRQCLEAGIPPKEALMLLPNAHNLRVIESGSLFDWIHRWKQRLCLLVQEELFFITIKQARQFVEKMPEAATSVLAPCAIRKRAGLPPCPEGKRWCGQAVFNFENLEQYAKRRVI